MSHLPLSQGFVHQAWTAGHVSFLNWNLGPQDIWALIQLIYQNTLVMAVG